MEINERSRLAQKIYKIRHDWVGKVIRWELYKKFISNHTKKWHIQKPQSVLKNDPYKITQYLQITHKMTSIKSSNTLKKTRSSVS